MLLCYRNVKERLLGMQFLDALRNGVASLKNKTLNPQLPCIIATFLARTSLILAQTHHAMYIPLQNFIIAKLSLNLNTVPEFFTFFHSSEVEFRWISFSSNTFGVFHVYVSLVELPKLWEIRLITELVC